MRPMNPYEENLLRELEEQLSEDDPRLAARLRTLCPSALDRLAPTRWPPRVFMTIGILFCSLGIVLGVGSSVLGGLLAIGLWWLRSLWLHRSDKQRRHGGGHGAPYSLP